MTPHRLLIIFLLFNTACTFYLLSDFDDRQIAAMEKIHTLEEHVSTLETRLAGMQLIVPVEFVTPTKRPKAWLIKK